jgi:hypothetical protein
MGYDGIHLSFIILDHITADIDGYGIERGEYLGSIPTCLSIPQ